jgi:hypothetical protein
VPATDPLPFLAHDFTSQIGWRRSIEKTEL